MARDPTRASAARKRHSERRLNRRCLRALVARRLGCVLPQFASETLAPLTPELLKLRNFSSARPLSICSRASPMPSLISRASPATTNPPAAFTSVRSRFAPLISPDKIPSTCAAFSSAASAQFIQRARGNVSQRVSITPEMTFPFSSSAMVVGPEIEISSMPSLVSVKPCTTQARSRPRRRSTSANTRQARKHRSIGAPVAPD